MALPSTFQRIEYIEATGTQYINTGVPCGDMNTYKIIVDVAKTGELYGDNYCFLMCATDSGNNKRWAKIVPSNTTTYSLQLGGTQTGVAMTVDDVHNRHTIELDFVNSTVRIDNNVTSATGSSVAITGNIPLLGNLYNGTTKTQCRGKLYKAYIYDNETPIREFVPVKRVSDSVVGVYDLVNDVFYTNAGSGTFSYGPNLYSVSATISPENSGTVTGTGDYTLVTDVTLTATPNSGYKFVKWELDGYTKLDYTQSNGAQYIDTKISFTANPTNKTGLEIKFNPQVASGQTCLCGCENNGNTWNFAMQFYNGVIRTYHGSLESWQPVSITANQDYTLSIFQENGTLTRTLNDTTVTASTGMSIPSRTFTLFADSTTNLSYNQFSSLKIYYCKIYDNGVLIRDYIPAIRHSDMSIGLFDLVNMKFYGSNGTYPFNGGAL